MYIYPRRAPPGSHLVGVRERARGERGRREREGERDTGYEPFTLHAPIH